MVRDRKQYKQSFYYRGKEYQYRIQSSSLRRFQNDTGLDAESINMRTTEGRYKLLYYCTCWKGDYVSIDTFLNDCKTGRASFRPGAREYGGLNLFKLFAKKIRDFKLHGEL